MNIWILYAWLISFGRTSRCWGGFRPIAFFFKGCQYLEKVKKRQNGFRKIIVYLKCLHWVKQHFKHTHKNTRHLYTNLIWQEGAKSNLRTLVALIPYAPLHMLHPHPHPMLGPVIDIIHCSFGGLTLQFLNILQINNLLDWQSEDQESPPAPPFPSLWAAPSQDMEKERTAR